VADQTPEARIRDLQRRLDLDPGSRLFVSLAEEYRKIGRLKDSLSALQKGLLAHPGYVAAQVALGRVYVEAGQTTDAVATFTKVLVADPGNLVAAKSLADIYMARGDKLEAVKKYKLYRALSGDRKVDPVIAELETQVTPKPIVPARPPAKAPVEPPPPPKFQETDKSRRRAIPKPLPSVPDEAPFEVSALQFELGDDSGKDRPQADEPFLVPTRDAMIAAAPFRPTGSVSASAAPPPPLLEASPPPSVLEAPSPRPIPEAPSHRSIPDAPEIEELPAQTADVLPFPTPMAPPPAEPPAPPVLAEVLALPPEADEAEPEPEPEMPAEAPPTGRALADLYYAQGHYAEALQIYDDLVSRHPFDNDLKRMRRDAEARLLPAGATPGSLAPDPSLERRLASIRKLKHWLSLVQAG
jgi:tetratricopeptide (TPR) repeat protein